MVRGQQSLGYQLSFSNILSELSKIKGTNSPYGFKEGNLDFHSIIWCV
jgi:hypothetical protein